MSVASLRARASRAREAKFTFVTYCNSKPSTLIPILDQYSLHTRKRLYYIYLKKLLDLKQAFLLFLFINKKRRKALARKRAAAKAYKTKEGLKEMEKIVLGMNSGRHGKSLRRSRSF